MKNIPLQILAKRKELKESQGEFGKRFGVSHAAVSEWEAGKCEAPYKVIEFVHECDGYVAGLAKDSQYAKVGHAIADLVHELTVKEDY